VSGVRSVRGRRDELGFEAIDFAQPRDVLEQRHRADR
jgi:hypothetical protein